MYSFGIRTVLFIDCDPKKRRVVAQSVEAEAVVCPPQSRSMARVFRTGQTPSMLAVSNELVSDLYGKGKSLIHHPLLAASHGIGKIRLETTISKIENMAHPEGLNNAVL